MTYLVARTATQNPRINGRTLYVMSVGLWTLDPSRARKFTTRYDAEQYCERDAEYRVEELAE